MFEKFNINDLFLAHVVVFSPENSASCDSSYGYLTILKKSGESYIDLQNMTRVVTTTRDPMKTSYVIYKKEPLSNHYTQEGKKTTFTRKNAVNVGSQYYGALHDKQLCKAK